MKRGGWVVSAKCTDETGHMNECYNIFNFHFCDLDQLRDTNNWE